MENSKVDIGALIKTQRLRKGFTQEKLAELIGKNQQDVNRYESNNTFPKKETWQLICKVLDIPLDAYFSDTKAHEKTIAVSDAAEHTYSETRERQLSDLINLIGKEKEFIDEIELTRFLKRFPKLTEEKKKYITHTLKHLFKLI